MTEHFLHRPQVSTAFQQVSCKGVTEGVGRHRFGDSYLVDVFAQNLPRTHAGHRLPARIEKKNAFALTLFQFWPLLAEIDRDRANRSTSNRHQSLLRSF